MTSLKRTNFSSKLLSALVLTLTLASINDAMATSYKLDLLSDISQLGINDSFDLKVSVDDPFVGIDISDELIGFGFNFSYDASKLSFSSATAISGGDLAASYGHGWDDASGKLSDAAVAGTSFPGLPNQAQPKMSLATMTFKIVGAGNSQISVFSHYDSQHQNNGLAYGLNDNIDPNTAYLDINTAAVPEAETYAMLLAGLGIVGFTARRKTAV